MPTSHRRRSRPTRTVLAALLAVSAAAIPAALPTAAPAAAQARLVNVVVRTLPERPEPGDDVTVLTNIAGCPLGDVTVELYLTSSDGTTKVSTLMARTAAVTNLLLRTKAALQLPKALEGWYGIRVLCGTYRPAKEPMANTLFVVGPKPTKQLLLAGGSVPIGGSTTMAGNGCPGSQIEYDVVEGTGWHGPFEVTGTIPVRPDGTWSGPVDISEDSRDGPAQVWARCVAANQFGERVLVYYSTPGRTTITPAG